jgi:hypothetical protein
MVAEVSRLQELTEEQEAKLQAQDARLDSVVSDYQAQFSAAQAQRQTEFSASVTEDRTQLRTAIDEARGTIQTAVTQAQVRLDALVNEVQTESELALAQAREKAEAQQTDFQDAGQKVLDRLDELLAKAVKTVGVIGSTGMAGGYQIVADDQKTTANFWRWMAVAGLLGTIAAAVFALIWGIAEGFELDRFFAKAALAIPFAALAGYAISESRHHREQERVNRQIELQLASLDSYLVTLPEAEQTRIRGELAPGYFSVAHATVAAAGVPQVEIES